MGVWLVWGDSGVWVGVFLCFCFSFCFVLVVLVCFIVFLLVCFTTDALVDDVNEEFRCRDAVSIIPLWQTCNNYPDCPDGSDELFCGPRNKCKCNGFGYALSSEYAVIIIGKDFFCLHIQGDLVMSKLFQK